MQTLLSLTMKRAEFGGGGPLAAFARKVVGMEAAHGSVTEYNATAEYAKAQDAARGAAARPAQAAG